MDNISFNDNNNKGFKLSEVIIIVLITCSICMYAGISYGKTKYSDTVNINNLSSEKDNELNNFIKQYKHIIKNYYDSDKIDEKKLMKVALQSILEELGIDDVYSTYMDDDEYTQSKITLNGNYSGIGITAGKSVDNGPIIVAGIIENSPASKADIKPGDEIISIDGKNTSKMTTKEFSNYVLKGKDKVFVLKINRKGKEISVKLEKDNIELKSVESKVVEKDSKKIGYIAMSIFAANTYTQFKSELNKLDEQQIDSLVIDLRSNTGGHLTEVTKILNLFLEKKKVIYQLQKNKDKVKYYSKGKVNKEYPIIFIGNELTASASELFIISLKENLGAKLVGMKTYGKGTVQELVNLSNGDQYKITTKKWLSPNGNWINDTKGIEPDVKVQISSKCIEKPSKKNDNQYQEALKLAVKESKKK